MLSPSQRTLRARVAAYALHAQGGTSTKAGTAAFLARFEKQVDPDSTLLPAERARRAAFARKSYMGKLALKASRARGRQTMKSPVVIETSTGLVTGSTRDADRQTAA
jgi:hypothetical protein